MKRIWRPHEATNGKWTTQVTVVDQEQYSSGPFKFGSDGEDGSLETVITSLLNIRESIPSEYRPFARCAIEGVGGYEGSATASIKVTYTRPSLPEEIEEREKADDARRSSTEHREREQLRLLKAKYEPGWPAPKSPQ